MLIIDAPAASGLLLVRDFLDPQECADVRAAARAAAGHPAPVYIEGAEGVVHEDVRRTTSLEVSAETAADVGRRLQELREEVGRSFGLSLNGCEPPQFLRYGEGDFFVRHQDGDTDQIAFDHLRVRKVSVVVFLNGGSDVPSAETFGGGAATQLPAGREGLELLEQSAVAVTFFRRLERSTVGQLDNERYGIVVRSLERPTQMGGALPRMPGIVGEWEQFQHARRRNGKLLSFEPFEIYRHDLVKLVEPDADWQPTGVPAGETTPWHHDAEVCAPLTERARDLVIANLFGREPTTRPFEGEGRLEGLDSVYVTVYIKGRLRGCMGGAVRALDEDLQSLARAALDDSRFQHDADAFVEEDVAVSVSLLYDELVIGACPPEEVVRYFRHGHQALMAYSGERVGLLLPFAASMFNLDPLQFAREVLLKAGLTEPPYYWCRFGCATWLADARGVHQLVGGFPRADEPSEELKELLTNRAALHAQYLLRHQKPDGSLYTYYEPFQNRLYEGVDLPRQAHAAWVLARAARVLGGEEVRLAADRVLDYLFDAAKEGDDGLWLETSGQAPSVAELSFLLLTLCESAVEESTAHRALAGRAAATLWNCVTLPHGRVRTHRGDESSADEYQDYFPGQALLALASAAASNVRAVDEERLSRAFLYYRHRFRHRRGFGQVSWYSQAFARWWQVTRDERFADFVFEIVDWLLTYQQETTGAFINDHQPETPGYMTAVYLEAVAAASNLAASLNDERRQRTYTEAFERGLRFLDRLVIQPRDASVLPGGSYALGGLRRAVHYSEVRTDFVQHALSAVLELTEERAQFFDTSYGERAGALSTNIN